MDEETRTTGDGADQDEGASGRFGKAKEYMGTKYNAVREKVEDVDFGAITDQIRGYVRSNPGKALLISVGVGFLIGMLLRSSDDDQE
jgi:ElaB/YqjD/DUF883 family membrane-anchored ribosome-binding protein